jgi:streptogramin lyase
MRIPPSYRLLLPGLALVLLAGLLLPLPSDLSLAAPLARPAASAQVLETPLNEDGLAYEINAEPDGTLWVSDNLAGEIRAYAPDGSEVTIFSGLGSVSDARGGPGGYAWLVDQDTHRLSRLDPAEGTLESWDLPQAGAAGFGTALDEQGFVWVSDFGKALLFRFNPNSMEMCTYDTGQLAGSGSPYVAIQDGYVWLSAIYHNAVLRFDPSKDELTRWQFVSSTWDFEAEGITGDGEGGLWFADSNKASVGRLDLTNPQAPRFLRYPLPKGYGSPAMLARSGSLVWYSAWGISSASLGSLNPPGATPSVFTPTIESMTLDPDCQTLPPGEDRAVEVTSEEPVWSEAGYPLMEPSDGWQVMPLPAESFPWGVAIQSTRLWAVDQGRSKLLQIELGVRVTACAVEDADGDLGSDHDRTPRPGLAVNLRADGKAESPSQTTGADGCTAWLDLLAGPTYGVELLNPGGETLLTPAIKDFDTSNPGEAHRYEFILTPGYTTVYVPLVRR